MEQLVRTTWAALSEGHLTALEATLAPDARWRAVEDGPWNCESRAQIIQVMTANLANGLAGEIVDVVPMDQQTLVSFKPSNAAPGGWPLENGIRWLVLTTRDGLITEMKGCATRAAAEDYASSGE